MRLHPTKGQRWRVSAYRPGVTANVPDDFPLVHKASREQATAQAHFDALARQIGARITVNRRPPGVSLISRDCFIRGIRHDIDIVNSTWLTTWTLQDATRYANFLVLDHPVLGVLDSAALAY